MRRVEIIAECGINACGDIDTAKKQIDEAVIAGVDAVKFAAYDTDLLVDKNHPLYQDLKRAEFTMGELMELAEYSPIEWFATPSDITSVELLEDIGVKRYKVGGVYEIKDQALLKAIRATGKPVIVSAGNKYLESALEILEGVPLTLLYCVNKYPTPLKLIDFAEMDKLREYGCPVGFSDHTEGVEASVEAVRKGACLIEKHFTTDRTLPGCDQCCSLEKDEMKKMVERIRRNEHMGRKIR